MAAMLFVLRALNPPLQAGYGIQWAPSGSIASTSSGRTSCVRDGGFLPASLPLSNGSVNLR